MVAHADSGGGSLPAQWLVDGDGTLNILDEFAVTRASLTADGKLNMYRADATIVAQVTGPGEGFRLFDAAGEQVVARMSSTGFYGPGLLTSVSVPVSSAEILASHTDPVTLVASPGPGKALVPFSLFLQLSGATSAYVTSGHTIGLYSGTVLWSEVSGITGSSADIFANFGPATSGADASLLDDQPLTLFTTTANPTGGDGDLTFSLAYYVVDIA